MANRKANLTVFAPTRENIFTAPEVCNAAICPMRWLVEDVIPLEGVTLLVAPPKIGKSILILNVITQAAAGLPVLDYFPCESNLHALYIDLEGTRRRTGHHMMNILGHRPIPTSLDFVYEWAALDQGGISSLYDYAKYHPHTKLIIIDTFERFQKKSQVGSYNYKEDVKDITQFNTFSAKTGVSIILVHHTRKTESPDWVDMVSGTYGLSGSVDTIMFLKRERGGEEALLHVTGRDVEENIFRLKANMKRQKFSVVGTLEEEQRGLSQGKQEILTILKSNEAPMKSAEIAELSTLHPGSIKRLLANMVEDKLVVKVDRGVYTDRIK